MRKKRILFVQPPYIAGAMISLKEQIVQFKVKGYAIDLIISGKYDEKIEKMFQDIGVIPKQCHLDKVFYDENSISYAVMH